MHIELVRLLWVAPLNFLGDLIRHALSVGPKWKMHLRLARKLVDRQSWFMIPLTSGTQSPIFDAIEYLVRHKDRESISRLERLFEKYCKSRMTLHSERLHGGTVTYAYGPQDYVPRYLQYVAVKALLDLYSIDDALKFVESNLAKENLWRLDESTIRILLAYSIRTNIGVDGSVLAHSLAHINTFVLERKQQALSMQR